VKRIYLSKAPGDVRDYDGSGDWFKVYELGTTNPWNGTDQGWLTRDLKQFEFRLPKEIPAGQYLMRIEQISIHPPYRQKEFYMQVSLDVNEFLPAAHRLTYLACSVPISTLPASTRAELRAPRSGSRAGPATTPTMPAWSSTAGPSPPRTISPYPARRCGLTKGRPPVLPFVRRGSILAVCRC